MKHDVVDRLLPYALWWPLVVGAAVGVAVRIAFLAEPGESFAAMSVGLLFVSPLVVGAVTVYVAERQARRSWSYYASAAALANVFYVAGTVAVLLEGILCAIVALPLFMLIGAVGGLMMGYFCRLMSNPKGPLLCVAVMPFVVGALEKPGDLATNIVTVERSVTVAATPQVVWQSIVAVPALEANEVPGTWLYRMGLPPPLTGVIRDTTEGPVRRVTMGNDVYFDEIVQEWRPPELVGWRYRFYDDSFPHGMLDEHVAIGGHYFDFIDTAYRLRSAREGTSVTMTLRYRLTTPFNWYAAPFAEWLLGDLMESNLGIYRRRAEIGGPRAVAEVDR